MPKRTGYLYEQLIDYDNCLLAEKEMLRGKRRNRTAKRMRANPEAYALRMQEALENATWEPHPYREKIIFDSHRHKYRNLKIPCLEDQAIHHAVMRVTVPHIMRRNYFYNCGSIPGAGQIRITRAIRRWLKSKTKVTYGAIVDIRHFYDNLPHWVVMRALERMFKDSRFIRLHAKILKSMSDTGIGIAIGFYPSAWYGNIAIAFIDRLIEGIKGVRFCRYMDDIGMVSRNKRALHKAIRAIMKALGSVELELKRTWQVFRIAERGFSFLSYRFFHGFTLMQKGNMYRIARKCKRAHPITEKRAASIVSSMGLLKHCNSFNFRKKHVYPHVKIKKCKEVISRAAKAENRLRRASAAI